MTHVLADAIDLYVNADVRVSHPLLRGSRSRLAGRVAPFLGAIECVVNLAQRGHGLEFKEGWQSVAGMDLVDHPGGIDVVRFIQPSSRAHRVRKLFFISGAQL